MGLDGTVPIPIRRHEEHWQAKALASGTRRLRWDFDWIGKHWRSPETKVAAMTEETPLRFDLLVGSPLGLGSIFLFLEKPLV